MPTAARLISAVLLAALGWVLGELIKPYLPEGTPARALCPVAAIFGVIVGWTHTGKRAKSRNITATGLGLSTGLLLTFWVLLFFSVYEMLRLATRLRYDGPMQALRGMFQLAIDYIVMAAQMDVLIVLVLGALIVGAVAKWSGRKWP